MPIVTLLTDFGNKDGNVGVMRGVILGICSSAQIVDISHEVEAQNITEAAFVSARAWPFFPRGTIHVLVVDPGVGTSRRALAARLGDQFFVGPDNGIITFALEQAERDDKPVEMVTLDQPRYWLPAVSRVFHGRDVFAPCAAHLACGTPLHDLGTPILDPVRLPLPVPQPTPHGCLGAVIYVDHFGNLISNIRSEHLDGMPPAEVEVHAGGVALRGLVGTFGDRPAGDLVALFGSTGYLMISAVNASAARRLNAGLGAVIEVSRA